MYVGGGCSSMLVWILSFSWLCHNFWKTLLLKHFFMAWNIDGRGETGRGGEAGISRHCQRLWLTELQSVIYQLQLALSEERRKRGVTLTTRNSRGQLCPYECEASLNTAALSHIKASVLETSIPHQFEENLYRSINIVLLTPTWTCVLVLWPACRSYVELVTDAQGPTWCPFFKPMWHSSDSHYETVSKGCQSLWWWRKCHV